MVLPIDEPILARQRRAVRRQVLQPLQVRRAPVRPLAEGVRLQSVHEEAWDDVGPRQHRRLILLIYAGYPRGRGK
jgi:hypothetical protein